MTGFDVSAPLFAIASRFVTDGALYYLHGVHIEPHPAARGVLLVATDGHRLLCAHDGTGRADRPAIIQLDRLQLAIAADEARPGYTSRRLYGTYGPGDRANTHVEIVDYSDDGQRLVVGAGSHVEIDGDFPDWSRRISREPVSTPALADFNGDYLADFAAAGAAYREAFGLCKGADAMTVAAADPDGPAIVRWAGIESMFGVLMPRSRASKGPVGLPGFFMAAYGPDTSA